MKRLTLKISKDIIEKIGFEALFRNVEQVEIQRIYRFDGNTMIAIQKFKFFDIGFTPDTLGKIEGTGIKYIEELSKIDKATYICLVKTEKEDKFHEILNKLNLIIDYPLIVTQDSIEISLIGDESLLEEISAFLPEKDFKIMKISDIIPRNQSINALLTPRQFEIIQYAVDNGFFEIPRRIKSKVIADKFKISVSAFNELLRRVERTIFTTYF